MSKRRRNVYAAFSAVGVLLASATACGGDDGGSDDGSVTLRMAWWGNDSRHQLTEEAIALFEEKNPGIQVEPEYTDFTPYYDRLTTQVASREAPDVFAIEIRRLGEFANNEILADLTDRVDTADMDPNVLASGVVNDQQVGIPTGANTFSLMANTAVFEEAGVELPDDTTWTWDDYLEISQQISEATGDGTYGSQPSFNDAFLRIFAEQQGEQMYTEDGLGVSEEMLVEWFELQLEHQDAGAAPDAALSAELGSSVENALVATNDGAFGMWWSNQLSTISIGSGEDIELLRFPTSPGAEASGMFLQPGMFWSSFSGSEHPEEAATLIDFLLNDPEAGAILGSDRGLPVNSTVRESIQADLPEADVASLEFFNEIASELSAAPTAPPLGAGDIPDMLERYGQEVLFGNQSPQEAASAFLAEADSALG
ncbi:ABC transporter substrate-binding protein [Streptomyces johnsoniae]|uniref:Extracellular solute-binding protein n=1 Tax=Streptomyces johnsoniae TaxID=3075532 RepID=A0ABU2SCM0_9ACTN|nr:extracellular solute-binding protein [Streptomyces sp. DSM 41886]MDT0446710.1 extracellular solute-binding protein [Streptomyces sp. DSM 41886]